MNNSDNGKTAVYAYTSTNAYLKKFDTVEKWKAFVDDPNNGGLDFESGEAMVEFYNAIYEKYGDEI